MIKLEIVAYFPGDEYVELEPNFSPGEFKCKGGDWPWLIDNTLPWLLQLMRGKLAKPIRINSGYRTPEYNKDVGGAKQSKHMLGLAADLDTPDKMSSIAFAGLAYACGFRRIGVSTGFVHVDVAPGEAYWAYTGDLKEGLQDKIERAAKQWQ